MQASEKSRFGALYAKHVTALKLQGKAEKTIESYARAVRRVAAAFDRCPDNLSVNELRQYFADYVASHSWSAIKIDRNGLRFFKSRGRTRMALTLAEMGQQSWFCHSREGGNPATLALLRASRKALDTRLRGYDGAKVSAIRVVLD